MSQPRRLPALPSVSGRIRVPGDKSISHRALLFAALGQGTSRVEGLAPGEDVRSTQRCLEALGVAIREEPAAAGERALLVEGRGFAGLDRPEAGEPLLLDCGNSGTTSRLLLGVLAGRRGRFTLTGDASLSRRPMRRVKEPLSRLGARFEGGDTLPITVDGSALCPASIEGRVASAQVKSAVLLAGLQAEGVTRYSEPRTSRDHTERMLGARGAPLVHVGGGSEPAGIEVRGPVEGLAARDTLVPGDPSSAAYALALGCLLPESRVVVEQVSLNPTRLGFVRLLERMGGHVVIEETHAGEEPIGTIETSSSTLRGIEVGPEDVVDAIDELPLLAVVAATAAGRTTIRGAEELRVKESDRIAATARLLGVFGGRVSELPDGMVIEGGAPLKGGAAEAEGDHRIAMCAAVAAALAEGESSLSGGEWVAISYPGFFEDLARLAGGEPR